MLRDFKISFGMRRGDHRETPMKLHLVQPNLCHSRDINTFTCFAGTTNLAQRWNLCRHCRFAGTHNLPHRRNLHQCRERLHLQCSFCRERPCHVTVKLRPGQRSGVLEQSKSRTQRSGKSIGYRRSLEGSHQAMDMCRATIGGCRNSCKYERTVMPL
jgi:hypothetical protein